MKAMKLFAPTCWLGCLALWLSVLAAAAQPRQIILLRHAEKGSDPADNHLSLKGRERALALAPYLTETPELLTNGLPVALFASGAQKATHSFRSMETLAPLGKQLNQPVWSSFTNKEVEALADFILRQRSYQGKTIVVCWTHEYIPELIAALGAPSPARKMKSSEFDRLYLITYKDRKATIQDLPQRLLYGDSSR